MESAMCCSNKKTAYTYDEAVELTGHGRYNYLLLAACSIILMAFALDVFGYAIVVSAAKCDLQLGLKEIGILASAPFAGVVFAFPWGYYTDVRGRRHALLLSTIIGFLFAAASSFTGNWQYMLAVKLLGCVFTTASFSLTMTFVGECTSDKHRSRFLCILNSFNLASELVVFGLAYFILSLTFNIPIHFLGITYRPWRFLSLMLSMPLLIGAVFVYCLYESPKYLASRGDNVKALEVLKRMYEINTGKKDYPVEHIVTDEELTQKVSFAKSLSDHTAPIFKRPLLWRTLQLFFLMSLCCSTNNVFVMWFPTIVNIFFKSFSEGTVLESSKSFCERINQDANASIDTEFINATDDLFLDTEAVCDDTIARNTMYSGMIFGLFYFLLNIAAMKVASRPRLLLLTVLLISGISANLINMRNPVANLVFLALVQITSLGIGCVASYFVDLYPTCNRGLVSSLGMMVARITSLVGVNIIGAVINTHCSVFFYGWSAFIFCGVLVTLLLPPDRRTGKTTA